eukprot:TRINITY_DN23075_c0_g1_i1.p1 TRINITY_DN23075_c0_g1~~TRINITY_DN23075_c0_g1_i1.p1  ORF type:complete len:460 (+),score=74.85 TRINITY_DN23075_c0_g1_i1:45-1382(+)
MADFTPTVSLKVTDMKLLREGLRAGCAAGNDIAIWDSAGRVTTLITPDPARWGGGVGVKPILPPVLAFPDENSGFATLAVSPDGNKLFTCGRAPLQNGNGTLAKSTAVRCVVVDVGDVTNPVFISQKVVLLTAPGSELYAAEWTEPDTVILFEKPTGTLLKVNVSTGASLNWAANDLTPEETAASTPNPFADLLKAAAAPMAGYYLYPVYPPEVDLGNVTGAFIVNPTTVVMAESGGSTGYSRIHVVKIPEGLPYGPPVCPYQERPVFTGGGKCRDISTVCPEGGLAGDMAGIGGLAVSGTVFLGVGAVMLIVHTLKPHHWVFGKFMHCSAFCLVLAWVLLLAAWVRTRYITSNTYSCLFLDESARSEPEGGGLALLTGELEYLTMPSYSWAFCIYAWGMLTLSLIFVVHHETVLVFQKKTSFGRYTTMSPEGQESNGDELGPID